MKPSNNNYQYKEIRYPLQTSNHHLHLIPSECYLCSFSFSVVRSFENTLHFQIHFRFQVMDSYLRKNLVNLLRSSFTQSQHPSTWIGFQLKIPLKKTGISSGCISDSTIFIYKNQLFNVYTSPERSVSVMQPTIISPVCPSFSAPFVSG